MPLQALNSFDLPRRKFRLIIWSGVVTVCVLSSVIASICFWQSLTRTRRASWRHDGLAASRAGDAVGALDLLGKYLCERPDDVEALFQFALVRRRVLAPRQGHIKDAVTALQRCTDLAPNDPNNWMELASTYALYASANETAAAARRACAIDPENNRANGLLATSLLQLGQIDEARSLLETAGENRRPDWHLDLIVLNAMLAAGSPVEEISDKARQLMKDAPDRPQNGILAVTASLMAGNEEAAKESLDAAIGRRCNDPDYLRALVRLADAMGEPQLGLKLLDATPSAFGDPHLLLWYVRRSWEAGRPDQVVWALRGSTSHLATDPEVNLLHILALSASSGNDKIEQLLNRIEKQQQTEAARRWYRLICLTTETGPHRDRLLANAAADVLEVGPASSVVHYLQSQAYYRLGEYRVAAAKAEISARLSPGWAQPVQRQAECLVLCGQVEEAAKVALHALARDSRSVDAALTLATAQAMQLRTLDENATEGFLQWIDHLERNSPESRVAGVALAKALTLIRLGRREEAERVVAQSISKFAAGDQRGLARVAAFQIRHGLTNDPPAELDPIDPAELDLSSRGGYVALPGDAAGWEELLSKVDADPFLFRLALISSPVRSDLAVQERLIRQLADRSPSGAVGWRLLRARWLLESDRGERNAASAVLVLRPVLAGLPDHVDAHLILMVAFARLHDHGAAQEHLAAAISANPRRGGDALRMTLACRRDGFWTDATSLVAAWVEATRMNSSPSSRDSEVVGEGRRTQESDENLLVDRLMVLAEYAEQSEDSRLAAATYRALLRIDANLDVANNNLAVILGRDARYRQEAIALAQRAITAKPDRIEYQATLESIRERLAVETGDVTVNE